MPLCGSVGVFDAVFDALMGLLCTGAHSRAGHQCQSVPCTHHCWGSAAADHVSGPLYDRLSIQPGQMAPAIGWAVVLFRQIQIDYCGEGGGLASRGREQLD